LATVLNHTQLDNESQNCDPDEKHVVENAFEDIELSKFDLLGIDLIENLHEDESLENVSEMETLLGGGFFFKYIWQFSVDFHPALNHIFE